MTRRTAAVLVAILAALAPASAQETVRPPTIVIEGSASTAVVPDTALLSISVVTVRPQASDAVADNSRAMAAAIAALKAESVPSEDIATTVLALTPVPDDPAAAKPRIKGYEARAGLTVRLKLAADVGRLAAKLVDRGVNAIDDLSFASSDEAAARDRLKAEAARDARRQAQIYAAALGLTLGRVLEVRPAETAERPYARLKVMRAASAPVPVEAGRQGLTERVSVTFELLP